MENFFPSEKKEDENLDWLKAGGEILGSGDLLMNQYTMQMQSGETLTVSATRWSLKNAEGKELANSQKTPEFPKSEQVLADGAKLITTGMKWIIDYPNGDRIDMSENNTNHFRAMQVSVQRADGNAKFAVTNRSDMVRMPETLTGEMEFTNPFAQEKVMKA